MLFGKNKSIMNDIIERRDEEHEASNRHRESVGPGLGFLTGDGQKKEQVQK